MRKILYGMILLTAFSGCSQDFWKAKYYLFKAESAFEKAEHKRTVQKIPHDQLRGEYARACDDFVRAYIVNPKVFFLYHIQHGIDACWRGGESFNQEKMERFEKSYMKEHPVEAEYGEMGLGGLEG
ncbi:MAG: hypothetical protein WC352_05010 [Candidatus Omnitrophota bacterium]|jgi:hypothetical protein